MVTNVPGAIPKSAFDTPRPRQPVSPVLISLSSCAILGFVVSLHPQGLHFYDPVIQMLALRQHEAGFSPSWNALMRVSPDDLTRSIPEWIAWWPPSTQLLVSPLRVVGLNPALALRVVALAAVAIGSTGWVTWFRRFDLPRSWVGLLALTLPWLHYASENFFRYSAEALAFAAAPWVLLSSARLLGALRGSGPGIIGWALATGLAISCAYWLKYSLFVAALAALAGVGLALLRARGPAFMRSRSLLALVLAFVLAGIGPLSLRAFFESAGTSPLSHNHAQHFDPMGLVYVVSNPVLAAADAFGPLFFAFVYPGLGPLATHNMATIAWIALPAGLLSAGLLIAALRDPAATDCTQVGVLALFLTSGAIFILWEVADLDQTSRLFAPAALGTLPILLATGRRLWPSRGPFLRLALVAALLGFVVLPLGFGPFYVAAKVREGRLMAPGPTGLSVPNLTSGDAMALEAALAPKAGANTIWVVTDPEVALELSGRAIWVFAGHDIAGDLQNVYARRSTIDSWRASKPVQLLALLPRSYGFDTPPAMLKAARRVRAWERTLLPDPNLLLWTGTLAAGESAP